jgi:hypothetical protein
VPRLQSGELASSTRVRADIKQASVTGLIALMAAAIDGPESAPGELIAACRSQLALTRLKLTVGETVIVPMSINTITKYVKQLVPGGWREFDALRLSLHERTIRPEAKVGSKQSLKAQKGDLQSRLRALNDHVFRFSAQYVDLLEKFRAAALESHDVKRRLDDHLRRYPPHPREFHVVTGGRDVG